ncbi:uncharacterized protein LOC131150499 isoform X2 [Malania oleifera]|uniref:uncharacterized protein LOC131150499 isoform X2 n=1 Tax=Malania oleifera TaxID=397392 RepID=UPI0025ADADBC|nr:uncharacterized protein LOC131150499 isoform X2 [Malania oleifera]
MGTNGSSSRRRSSSSLKKKRSKNPSEVRKRKSSRRNRPGKLRRCDDSISYSDEDDSGSSRSSVSYSSSSSEYDRRRRRSRSRTRGNVKSRKRDRTLSSSRENLIRDKKRKGSRRNINSDARKKIKSDARKKSSKKKPRRDVSLSSASSSSWSSSSSSDEGEFERLRGRTGRKERDKRREGKVNSGTKRIRYRSRSPSSRSRYSNGSGHHSEERLMIENSSRRLKSVITFAKEADENEGRELDEDEGKEEMIYDHDDYPCRSGDSNDGGSKKDTAYNSYVASEKRRQVENDKGTEAFFSEIRSTGNESGKGSGDKHEGSNHSLDFVQADNPSEENKREVPSEMHNPNVDDLESILRRKALENLRKFRIQTNTKAPAKQKDMSDSNVKQLSPAKAELGRWKPPQDDDIRVGGTAPAVDHAISPKMRADSFSSSQNEGKILEVKRRIIKSVVAKEDIVSPTDQKDVSGNIKEKMISTAGAITGKSELGTVSLRQKSSSTYSAIKQVPTSHISKENLLATKSSVDNSLIETAQTVPHSSNNNDLEVSNASGSAVPKPSSCLKSALGECNTKDETKEGSQFEQKTMSVMRGGEMVQVSYKVYIPKKAPALVA